MEELPAFHRVHSEPAFSASARRASSDTGIDSRNGSISGSSVSTCSTRSSSPTASTLVLSRVSLAEKIQAS